MSALTATRVESYKASTRVLYKLSEPVTRETVGVEKTFEHLVMSRGRDGDTCVFPSNAAGNIIDMVGFGYAWGPSRWLLAFEEDTYVTDCIRQHETDGGAGLGIATDWEAVS